MKTGILFPMAVEMGNLSEGMKHEKRLCYDFWEGELAGREVVLAISGVAKVNAALVTRLMLERGDVDKIIVCGVAGAIDSRLAIGDTVIATKSAHHDLGDDMIEGDSLNNIPHLPSIWMPVGERLLAAAKAALEVSPHDGKIWYGPVVSGEVFVEKDGREAMIARLDPMAADMETSAAAQVCFTHGLPYIAIRSITDTGEQCGLEVYFQNRETAAKNSQLVLQKVLTAL